MATIFIGLGLDCSARHFSIQRARQSKTGSTSRYYLGISSRNSMRQAMTSASCSCYSKIDDTWQAVHEFIKHKQPSILKLKISLPSEADLFTSLLILLPGKRWILCTQLPEHPLERTTWKGEVNSWNFSRRLYLFGKLMSSRQNFTCRGILFRIIVHHHYGANRLMLYYHTAYRTRKCQTLKWTKRWIQTPDWGNESLCPKTPVTESMKFPAEMIRTTTSHYKEKYNVVYEPFQKRSYQGGASEMVQERNYKFPPGKWLGGTNYLSVTKIWRNHCYSALKEKSYFRKIQPDTISIICERLYHILFLQRIYPAAIGVKWERLAADNHLSLTHHGLWPFAASTFCSFHLAGRSTSRLSVLPQIACSVLMAVIAMIIYRPSCPISFRNVRFISSCFSVPSCRREDLYSIRVTSDEDHIFRSYAPTNRGR